MKATFYTVSDSQFFVGTVALLNSLRLTGNEGELVVLDCGLRADQRERLEAHCRVAPVPVEEDRVRAQYKPFVHTLGPSGLIVVIDSDVIVTSSLEQLLQEAADGKICVFRSRQAGRRFEAWQEAFQLTAPLREQPYVLSGLVAFSVARWPDLLRRWQEACDLAPRVPRGVYQPWRNAADNPFQFNDMDPLNALLASEIPESAISAWDRTLRPDPLDGRRVQVVDTRTLRCVNRGREALVLHCMGAPKPWQRRGWAAKPFDAFTRLLPRVVLAEDVPLRLRPEEVPVWLRGGLAGRSSAALLRGTTQSVGWVMRRLPDPARRRAFDTVRGHLWRRRLKA